MDTFSKLNHSKDEYWLHWFLCEISQSFQNLDFEVNSNKRNKFHPFYKKDHKDLKKMFKKELSSP
jgi:hypothetical protein